MATTYHVPDALPVLSRGKHRNPRKGACFMETASVLANERWSDRPACTDPLLGHLARMVNDLTDDERRNELAILIPDVIGLHGDGLDWEVAVVGAVASRALPYAPESHQRALAVGLVRCLELAQDPGRVDRAEIRSALAAVPFAERWARDFTGMFAPVRARDFHRHAAPAILRSAVCGIAESTLPDRDGALRDLLVAGIQAGRRPAPLDAASAPPRADSPVEETPRTQPSPAPR